ncbi:hypothetical protein LINPERPRIM_LOCUS19507 [Linum perenne]
MATSQKNQLIAEAIVSLPATRKFNVMSLRKSKSGLPIRSDSNRICVKTSSPSPSSASSIFSLILSSKNPIKHS